METNEIMENEEIIETTEGIVDACAENGMAIAVGVGLTALVVGGGVFAYKKFGKPFLAKIKAKKEQASVHEQIVIKPIVKAEVAEEEEPEK